MAPIPQPRGVSAAPKHTINGSDAMSQTRKSQDITTFEMIKIAAQENDMTALEMLEFERTILAVTTGAVRESVYEGSCDTDRGWDVAAPMIYAAGAAAMLKEAHVMRGNHLSDEVVEEARLYFIVRWIDTFSDETESLRADHDSAAAH